MGFSKGFFNKNPLGNKGASMHLAGHNEPGEPLKLGFLPKPEQRNIQSSVNANTKAFSGKKDPKFTGVVPSPVSKSDYGLGSSRSNNFNSWNNEPEFETEAEKKKSQIVRNKIISTNKKAKGTKALNDIQDKLETAGMTPLAGVVPDAANVGISAARGLYAKYADDKQGQLDASMNMAAFGLNTVPLLGLASASLNKTRKLYNKTKNIYKGSLLSSTGRAESKLLKNPNYTRVYQDDGSSKIMEKSKALHLNRIEDANITNEVYKDPKIGYDDYNWAGKTKGEYAAGSANHYLNNTKRLGGSEKNFSTYNLGKDDNRRLISMYFDPEEAESFSVFNSTKEAYEKSGNKANEFVIPPEMMKNIRSKKSGYGFTTTIGNKSNILEQMSKF